MDIFHFRSMNHRLVSGSSWWLLFWTYPPVHDHQILRLSVDAANHQPSDHLDQATNEQTQLAKNTATHQGEGLVKETNTNETRQLRNKKLPQKRNPPLPNKEPRFLFTQFPAPRVVKIPVVLQCFWFYHLNRPTQFLLINQHQDWRGAHHPNPSQRWGGEFFSERVSKRFVIFC